MKWRYSILILVSLLLLLGCAPHEVESPLPGEEARQVVEVEVIDQLLLYRCQSFWSAEKFAQLSQDDLEKGVKEKYDVDAREFQFSFDPANQSTVTRCRIYGTITRSGDNYTADLLWLLRPHQLDFIDSDFKESKTGLSWEGTINDISMRINVKCPPQDCVYEAWQHPVGHCHGHIWWPASSQQR
jgi:hypothetical protein